MQVRTFLRESDLCRIVVARIHFGGFGHSTVCLAQEKWLKISSCNRTSWRPEGCFAQVFQSDPQINRTLKHIETWFIYIYIRFISIPLDDLRKLFFGGFLISRKCDTEPDGHSGIQEWCANIVLNAFKMPFQGYAFKGSLWLFLTWISENAINQVDD